jgi:hypothetical protein
MWRSSETIKVLAAFTGLFGTVFGAFGTYFFTREPIGFKSRRRRTKPEPKLPS